MTSSFSRLETSFELTSDAFVSIHSRLLDSTIVTILVGHGNCVRIFKLHGFYSLQQSAI